MSARQTDAIDVLVGQNIGLQRMAKRMSQVEFGRRLGVSYQQVQKYEKGVNRIGSGRLLHIADIFQVPIAALFDGIGAPPAGSGVSWSRLTADRQSFRLLQAFAQIDDARLLRAIVALVEMTARPREVDRRSPDKRSNMRV
jgi:transcriptional regulator with XRE-family HTH domain